MPSDWLFEEACSARKQRCIISLSKPSISRSTSGDKFFSGKVKEWNIFNQRQLNKEPGQEVGLF